MRRRTTRFTATIAGALLATGCMQARPPHDPGAINHVVLITLSDPSEADALEADCARLLKPIPAVRTYACGGHHDIGRSNISGDYSVGLLVSFEDEAGYREYLEDPRHVELVETWKPRWSGITIHDIGNEPDETP